MENGELIATRIPSTQAGQRLDRALAVMFPAYSRSQLQSWIGEGRVRLDSEVPRRRDKVRGGELVEIQVPPPKKPQWPGQAFPLEVVYEDAQLLVINKPAGLVVHPGAGNPDRTLLNALLHYDPGLSQVARAGIVHRLDKDTSGLLVVARTEVARRHLAGQLAARTLRRIYTAIVKGVMIAGGTVTAPVGRHARWRTRMAVTGRGRPAVTHFRVAARYRAHTFVKVSLETGRTHQIRVHLAHQGYPIVGDPVYGGRLFVPSGAGERLTQALRHFRRQALHAGVLGLIHPTTGETLEWTRPVPADMQELLDALKEDAREHD